MKQILTCHEILQDFLKLVKTLKSQGKIQTLTQKHPHKHPLALTGSYKTNTHAFPPKKISSQRYVCKVSWHHFWLIANLFVVVCGRFRQAFLHFEDQNKWSLFALNRRSSYRVETVWELSWTDLKLVVF